MTSRRQMRANHQNSSKSTGPKTTGGKLRSSRNALKHGLTAKRAWLLPHESWRDFNAFWRRMVTAFDPKDAIDGQVVERAIGLLWRLRRVPEIEAWLYRWHRDRLKVMDDEHFKAQRPGMMRPDGIQFYPPARIFVGMFENDGLSKLNRYEICLDRQLMATFKLLNEIREARGSALLPLPPTPKPSND